MSADPRDTQPIPTRDLTTELPNPEAAELVKRSRDSETALASVRPPRAGRGYQHGATSGRFGRPSVLVSTSSTLGKQQAKTMRALARSLVRAPRCSARHAPRPLSTAAVDDADEMQAPVIPASFDSLGDEHAALRDMCRKFADEELAPNAGKWDKDHKLPREVIATMGELGLMGVA